MALDGQFNARIQRLEKMVENMPSGREVPKPSIADYGKVLGVDESGEYRLENVPKEVPTPSVSDAGKVITVGSSGKYELGGLPEYTLNELGKSLTVVEDSTNKVETIIVPSQSVTVSGEPSITQLSNIPAYIKPDLFQNGDGAKLTINGVEYSAIFAILPPGLASGFFVEENYAVIYQNDAWYFSAPNDGTFTVSLEAELPSANLEWKKDNRYETYYYGPSAIPSNAADLGIYASQSLSSELSIDELFELVLSNKVICFRSVQPSEFVAFPMLAIADGQTGAYYTCMNTNGRPITIGYLMQKM